MGALFFQNFFALCKCRVRYAPALARLRAIASLLLGQLWTLTTTEGVASNVS